MGACSEQIQKSSEYTHTRRTTNMKIWARLLEREEPKTVAKGGKVTRRIYFSPPCLEDLCERSFRVNEAKLWQGQDKTSWWWGEELTGTRENAQCSDAMERELIYWLSSLSPSWATDWECLTWTWKEEKVRWLAENGRSELKGVIWRSFTFLTIGQTEEV